MARLMSLIPKFGELEVEKIFNIFLTLEKVAMIMSWPTDIYYLFLKSVFTGKARYVYCTLSTVQCTDYEFVKEVILQAYDLFWKLTGKNSEIL